MSKIIINSLLKSSMEEEQLSNYVAILKDNKIYFNKDDINSIITLKNDKVIIERKCKEYDSLLEFEEGKQIDGKYFVKDIKLYIKISVKTKKLIIKENSILLKYTVYIDNIKSDDFVYEIKWRC